MSAGQVRDTRQSAARDAGRLKFSVLIKIMAAKEQAQQSDQLRHAGHTDAGTPRPRMPVKCQDKIATPQAEAASSCHRLK